MDAINLVLPLLRNREETIYKTLNGKSSGKELLTLLLTGVAMFSVYGLIIGWSQSPLQALSSALKLPLLFYFTSIICFPTLFFFLSFLGVKQSLGQLFGFIVICNTYIALVLTAFAPVSFFFLIAGYGYSVFKFINILIFFAAGFTGVYLFYKEMKNIIRGMVEEKGPDKATHGFIFLRGWAIMFGFIGLQLSFTLSPYFGMPNEPFIFITPENSNFFKNLMETIASLFISK
jgi:hypothetical protein